MHTGDEKDPGVQGLVHQRREPVKGTGMTGFECTIGVGKITMAKFHIPIVGTGVNFNDTEGNFVGAMQYEK